MVGNDCIFMCICWFPNNNNNDVFYRPQYPPAQALMVLAPKYDTYITCTLVDALLVAYTVETTIN